MRRTTTPLIALVLLLLMLAVPLSGCEKKVTVKTGEIVICTEGEILEDNTEEVEVRQSEVANYGVKTKVITCERHASAAGSLYERAQQAIADGDLAKARELLAAVVAQDPAYRRAKQQLAQIDAGETPTADPGEGSADAGVVAPPADEPDEPTGPVASLVKYVPDTVEGFIAQGIVADVASLSRQYLPNGVPANQLIIEVEQRVSDDAAAQQQAVIIGDYPDNNTARVVAGRNVVAGTRGGYAAAVFVDGPLTVIVELHGSSGADLVERAFAVVESITK